MKINYLSTPIYYANGSPHIGHLYTNLLQDVWVRVAILFDQEYIASTGIDEHGQKVYNKALERGYLAQDYTKLISDEFMQYFSKYNIHWSHWVRTSSPEHKVAVQHFWKKMEENGYIYKGKYEGWYDVNDETYINGKFEDCPISRAKENIIWKCEECYYFKLSAFQKPLEEFFANNKDFIFPKKRYNEVIGFLNQGLKDFAISRSKERQFWGIEVPGDPDQIVYVWIDALVNYLSVLGYPDEKYKDAWPGMHLLGKDILKFHAIYFPAILMAADVELPKKLIVHGWWLNGEEKISKSKGNAMSLDDITEAYRVDGVRYFMLKAMSIGEDATFSEEAIKKVTYNELSNRIGNIFLRMLGIVETRFVNNLTGTNPRKHKDKEITDKIKGLADVAMNFFRDPSLLDEYKNAIYECVMLINNLIEKNKVWQMEKPDECADILCFAIDKFKRIMIFAWPLIPTMSVEILDYLEVEPVLSDLNKNPPYEFSAFKPVILPKMKKTD